MVQFLLFKTKFRHRNRFLSSLVTDGMDGHELKIEQVRPIFFKLSSDTMPQKIAKKLLLLVSAVWLITSSSLYRCILCMVLCIKQ